MVTARNGNNTYGLTFNLFGYTPINTNSDSILYGDRPFSSALSIGYFSLSTDSVNNQRINSTLSLGLVGPLALGERIQTTIHRWLNNKLPRGWQHQVANDIIINYAINYEKKILTYKKMFLLNGVGQAKFGTLDIKISSGINFMAGYFNNPYKDRSSERKKKFELYLYGQGRVHAIGYNALLQGGLLNRNSPYTITNRNITRFVIQADAGIAMNFKKILLTYSRSYISKEFSPGKTHQWGGISIGAFF